MTLDASHDSRPGFVQRLLQPLFLITVVIPTALAIVYYGLIASDVYISESRFVVRTPEKTTPSALGLILKGTGFSSGADEIYAAQSAVISRDALQSLNGGGALNGRGTFEKAYSDPAISIADRFEPLGHGSFEDLYKLFKKKVTLEHDNAGGISVLTVHAYTPHEAFQFNEKLLEIAEAAVNRLNERGRADLIRFASKEVDESKIKAHTAARALAAFRQRTHIVDPDKQAAVELLMISKLQDELIATRTQIGAIEEVAPRNPQIAVLRTKARELQTEITNAGGDVAGNTGSLSAAAVEYQQLQMDDQVAQKQLVGALSSLDEARNEARRKQAYVERIVQPNLPDAPLEPRRWRGILSVLAIGIISYMAWSMLLAGMREHRD